MFYDVLYSKHLLNIRYVGVHGEISLWQVQHIPKQRENSLMWFLL